MRSMATRSDSLNACAEKLARISGSNESLRLFVPGRIEFLGKHTDYAGGRSLVCATEQGICVAFSEINGLEAREEYRANIRSPEELAGYLGAIENGSSFGSLAGGEGVGTSGGSQDHTAILCARAGKLCQYSFAPVHFEREVPLP